jgi:peroxiredoxin
MFTMSRVLIGILSGAVVLSLASSTLRAEGEDAAVSDFTLKTLKGESMSLHDELEGGPVLVSFWATWCKPCKQEMPHLVDIYESYAERGLTVMAVSIDQPRSASQVRKYVNSEKFPFTVLLDPNKDAFRKLQGQSVPYVVLLDAAGDPAYVKSGYRPGDEKHLEEAVAALFPADEQAKDAAAEAVEPAVAEGK